MSNLLLEKLGAKIDDMLETVELLRLQIAELEEKNGLLQEENGLLKSRQSQWEQDIATLLDKLEEATPPSHSPEPTIEYVREDFAEA